MIFHSHISSNCIYLHFSFARCCHWVWGMCQKWLGEVSRREPWVPSCSTSTHNYIYATSDGGEQEKEELKWKWECQQLGSMQTIYNFNSISITPHPCRSHRYQQSPEPKFTSFFCQHALTSWPTDLHVIFSHFYMYCNRFYLLSNSL